MVTSYFAKAQRFEVSGNPIQFENVIKVDSTLTAKRLYELGVEWFAKTYNNSKAVIQMQDKDAGIIVAKAMFQATIIGKGLIPTVTTPVDYTLKIQFRDGRLKYEMTDFLEKGFAPYGSIKDGEVTKAPMKNNVIRQYTQIQESCRANHTIIAESLKNWFTKQNDAKSKEW